MKEKLLRLSGRIVPFLIFIVLTPFSLLYAMTKIVMDFIQRVFHK